MKKIPFTTWTSFKVPWGDRVVSTFTRPLLSAEPEIYSRVLKDTDRFIIFGSGGFWKQLTNKQAAKIVNASPRDVCLWLVLANYLFLVASYWFVCL